MSQKPTFFVNLPLRHVRRDRAYLDIVLSMRLHPELGLDAMAIDEIPLDFHQRVAAELAEAGLSCSVHLPFFDIQPGSLDDLVLEATRERLRRAFELTRLYRPRHFVGHVAYTGLYVELYDRWLERSAATWRGLAADWPDHPPLFLENTYEREPKPLVDLMRLIGSPAGSSAAEPALQGAGRIGVCFDLGHWHSFAGGSHACDLGRWLDALAPHLGHLHLHDNDGSTDQHLGLGCGTIPFDELAERLAGLGLRPSKTLEPHTIEDLRRSLDYLKRRPDLLA